MACTDYEEILLNHRDPDPLPPHVESHLAVCGDCREMLEALAVVDAGLAESLAKVSFSPAFAETVRRRLPRKVRVLKPSLVPELLDLVGWAAVLSLVAVLLITMMPRFGIDGATVIVAGMAAALMTSLGVAFRAFTDLGTN